MGGSTCRRVPLRPASRTLPGTAKVPREVRHAAQHAEVLQGRAPVAVAVGREDELQRSEGAQAGEVGQHLLQGGDVGGVEVG